MGLLEGQPGPIWVGEVPYEIAVRLGLKNHNVYLTQNTLTHILDRHPDIEGYTLLLIPIILGRGLWVQERAKPNMVIASYYSPITEKRHMAVMKITANNSEVWLASFYRAHARQTVSLLKKGIILRAHK